MSETDSADAAGSTISDCDWSSVSRCLAAQRLAGQVSGDSADPGWEFFQFPEILQCPPGGHEGLLGQILAEFDVARERVGHRADTALIGRHEPAKRLPIPMAARAEQLFELRRFHDSSPSHHSPLIEVVPQRTSAGNVGWEVTGSLERNE